MRRPTPPAAADRGVERVIDPSCCGHIREQP
jgi:hypothetical protein